MGFPDANVVFLLLSVASVNSPLFAFYSLPPHRGSVFLPIWLTLVSFIVNALTLSSFSLPATFQPSLSLATSIVSAVLCTIQLILVAAVGQLRQRESILTLVVLSIAIVSFAHAAISDKLLIRYEGSYQDNPTPDDVTFGASLKRVCLGVLQFVGLSVPLAVLYIAILAVVFLLTLTVALRSYDASVQPAGQLWRIDPWHGHTKSYSANVHLACEEPAGPIVETDSLAPRNKVLRTVLIEADQGVAGQVGAKWVLDALHAGNLSDGDNLVRVCYWDRPGYGLSDNIPSSEFPFVVRALSQALDQAGELARFSSSKRSGLILVGEGYGAMLSSYFASLKPDILQSVLYVDPLPPQLHFSPRRHPWLYGFSFFFSDGLKAWTTELGIFRIWRTIRGSTRVTRVFSTERSLIRGEIERAYLQESSFAHVPSSKSAHALQKAKAHYPIRPHIVLRPTLKHQKRWREYSSGEYQAAQTTWIRETIGEGLLREDELSNREKALRDLIKK